MRILTSILYVVLAYILLFYQDDLGRVALCIAFLMGFMLNWKD